MATEQHGIAFARADEGDRSTAAAGRGIVSAALGAVDPVGARTVDNDTNWRSGYLLHFRRLVEAGIGSADDWLAIARAGLDQTYRHFVLAGPGGDDGLETVATAAPTRRLHTATVAGTRAPEAEFSLPYRGMRLAGDALRAQLRQWEIDGIIEPSVVHAVAEVMAHPEWLSLPGRTVVVLGAGAEMGPLTALLRWGASVAGVDLPRAQVWERVLEIAQHSAGTLQVPVAEPDRDLSKVAGADLLTEVPEVADWLSGLGGRLVIGTYLYADGGAHARLSVAADLLGRRVLAARPDTALAFLATPTDVFAVPGAAVDAANLSYATRSRTAKSLGRPLRWASRGRLLHRAYRPGAADPGICDSLVPIQGPNYALAKRLQRWRAATALADGVEVSFHVAPSTRTRSVVKNRALAAAYAGAHRFGVEVFEPGTSNTLMAALLVHDLMTTPPTFDHPWRHEADGAVHGGLWRAAYEPRSALGLAAVMGFAAARG